MASISGVSTSYCSVSSAVFTTSAYTITPAGYSNTIASTYTADLNMIWFTHNTYTANFHTNGNSLIHLEGAPRVSF